MMQNKIVISGPAGSGKSCLASVIADGLRTHLVDVKIDYDESEPLPLPGEASERLVRAAGNGGVTVTIAVRQEPRVARERPSGYEGQGRRYVAEPIPAFLETATYAWRVRLVPGNGSEPQTLAHAMSEDEAKACERALNELPGAVPIDEVARHRIKSTTATLVSSTGSGVVAPRQVSSAPFVPYSADDIAKVGNVAQMLIDRKLAPTATLTEALAKTVLTLVEQLRNARAPAPPAMAAAKIMVFGLNEIEWSDSTNDNAHVIVAVQGAGWALLCRADPTTYVTWPDMHDLDGRAWAPRVHPHIERSSATPSSVMVSEVPTTVPVVWKHNRSKVTCERCGEIVDELRR